MKLHIDYTVKKIPFPITHHHQLMLMGSCFTENIGALLRNNRFKVMENPHGILFNPVSVCAAVKMYRENEMMTEDQLFLHNEVWHSWRHHSRFSDITAAAAIHKINASTQAAHIFLQQSNYLFITVGSAWVYQLTNAAAGYQKGQVAANNHKAPANWFERRLLTATETFDLFNQMVAELKVFNPDLQIIFTISPVRHLREGLIDNNRSKAVLIQAIHELVAMHEHLYYFPAYELVIDDLRDYRFYAEDLVHPNYHATQYVWDKFTTACMSETTLQLLQQIREINLAYQHKPFNPLTKAHGQFLEKYAEITLQLMQANPTIDLKEHFQYFNTGVKIQAQE